MFNSFLTVLDTGFTNGSIALYSGAPPSDPSASPTGTYLGRVTTNGGAWVSGSPTNGLNMASPVLNTIDKESAETWTFTCSVPGTIGWGRFVGNTADGGSVSNTLFRMDFDVTLTGGGGACQMTKITFNTVGETGVVQTFTLPLTNRA